MTLGWSCRNDISAGQKAFVDRWRLERAHLGAEPPRFARTVADRGGNKRDVPYTRLILASSATTHSFTRGEEVTSTFIKDMSVLSLSCPHVPGRRYPRCLIQSVPMLCATVSVLTVRAVSHRDCVQIPEYRGAEP